VEHLGVVNFGIRRAAHCRPLNAAIKPKNRTETRLCKPAVRLVREHIQNCSRPRVYVPLGLTALDGPWPTRRLSMKRLLAGLFPLLVICSAYAEDVKDAPPPATTDVMGIAIFFILFFGLCAGFFGYMWWRHKHNKED
jgi:hypothetical protein